MSPDWPATGMSLVICTPSRVVVRADDVRYVRAADTSGSFGIQPHHAGLVSALDVSVVSWTWGTPGKIAAGFAAVRGGVLVVQSGAVAIAASEAEAGDDLEALERSVLAGMRARARAEAAVRRAQTRMELAALRLLYRTVSPKAGEWGGT